MTPLESTAIMCSPKNCPPFWPMLPSVPTTLPSSRLRNQTVLFDKIGNIQKPLLRIDRETHSPGGTFFACVDQRVRSAAEARPWMAPG